ncbi:MAG TPA: hypothetical protein VKW08_05815 [Xanthobacteraceae bacterium]|nr:hypothetical protein [Xanthobacteraceae bacterium]
MARGGPSNNFSAGPSRNFFGGDFRGDRGDRGDRDRFREGRDFGFGFGFYPGYDYYAYDYGDDCYQWRRVRTPYGWHWARVWVCY